MPLNKDTQQEVNIQNFIGVTNKAGTGTIWGDLHEIVRVSNLANMEVLGNVLNKKEVTIEDTFVYEYQYVPKIRKSDFADAGASSKLIAMEKATLVFNTPWLEAGYQMSLLTTRTMKSWGIVLAQYESNIYISKNDIDNLITLEKVIDYAYATGRYKLTKDLDDTTVPSTGSAAEKEKIVHAMTNVLETVETIGIEKTDVSWGQPNSRSQLVCTPYVKINFMRAANFINASDKSFNVFQTGELPSFGGLSYTTTRYLDRVDTEGQYNNSYKTFDFKNVLAFVFDIDNSKTYTKPNVVLGIDGWLPVPSDKTQLRREYVWKTICNLTPAREHLNYLFLRVLPTLVQVNAARARLLAEQPSFYKGFTPITQTELDIADANAAKPRLVGNSDTPQDGLNSFKMDAEREAKIKIEQENNLKLQEKEAKIKLDAYNAEIAKITAEAEAKVRKEFEAKAEAKTKAEAEDTKETKKEK